MIQSIIIQKQYICFYLYVTLYLIRVHNYHLLDSKYYDIV